jgi:putative ATPase
MKSLNYGKGYQYAHDYEEKITPMTCLPEALEGRRFYRPTDQGQEARYRERLEQILAWKKARRKPE